MCILFIRRFENGPFKFVIAFNRDEDVERPTEQLQKWKLSNDPDSVDIYSGIDKEKSGTWLALSSDGRFCCVTNNREAPYEFHPAVSRGNQVVEFFRHRSNEGFTQHLMAVSNGLAGSNYVYGSLVEGDPEYCEVKAGQCRSGTVDMTHSFVLANGGIGSEWPKQERGRNLFDQILSESKPIEELTNSLFELLHDRTECSHGLPTNTVLREDEERKASAIFIDPFEVKKQYGNTFKLATRSSTVIITTRDDYCWVSEETPGAGRKTITVAFI